MSQFQQNSNSISTPNSRPISKPNVKTISGSLSDQIRPSRPGLYKGLEGLNLDEDDHHSAEETNEKWLISYADMMTLLFGFFVLLYTIAMSTQGNPDLIVKGLLGKSDAKKEESNQSSPTEPSKDLEARLASINQQLLASKKENASLKAALEKRNFMMVVLNWNSLDHDLDLKVTDPTGRVFDFQNRSQNGSQSRFLVDSRSGPGVEVWETPTMEEGDYKVEVSFYNAHGNANPPEGLGSVVTNEGIYPFPNFKLDMAINRRVVFLLNWNQKSGVTIQPLK